jgi:pimeloyl-ACP methyl ester carboxylesterase
LQSASLSTPFEAVTMMREESLFLTNQSLNYAEGPANGPPLVLLHGVLRQWADYVSVIPQLASRWKLYGIDFRGHGKSSRTPNQYLVIDYLRDAASFLSYQLREPAVVYGHSLGAMVALHLAAEMREHVRAVILEDPPFQTMGTRIHETPYHSQFSGVRKLLGRDVTVGELARELAEVPITVPGKERPVRFGELRDDAQLRWNATCLKVVDPEVCAPILDGRWLEGYDVDRTIQRVRCPTLVLQADPLVGGMLMDEDANFMAQSIHDCVRIRFPGIGHAIRGSAFDPWLRAVVSFLESVRE